MPDMPPAGHSVQLPWILERVEMPYGREDIERLRRAVYSIGRVPESGFQGGVLSPRIAAVVLAAGASTGAAGAATPEMPGRTTANPAPGITSGRGASLG